MKIQINKLFKLPHVRLLFCMFFLNTSGCKKNNVSVEFILKDDFYGFFDIVKPSVASKEMMSGNVIKVAISGERTESAVFSELSNWHKLSAIDVSGHKIPVYGFDNSVKQGKMIFSVGGNEHFSRYLVTDLSRYNKDMEWYQNIYSRAILEDIFKLNKAYGEVVASQSISPSVVAQPMSSPPSPPKATEKIPDSGPADHQTRDKNLPPPQDNPR